MTIELHIHRSGRVARMENIGKSLALVTNSDTKFYNLIETKIGHQEKITINYKHFNYLLKSTEICEKIFEYEINNTKINKERKFYENISNKCEIIVDK